MHVGKRFLISDSTVSFCLQAQNLLLNSFEISHVACNYNLYEVLNLSDVIYYDKYRLFFRQLHDLYEKKYIYHMIFI